MIEFADGWRLLTDKYGYELQQERPAKDKDGNALMRWVRVGYYSSVAAAFKAVPDAILCRDEITSFELASEELVRIGREAAERLK